MPKQCQKVVILPLLQSGAVATGWAKSSAQIQNEGNSRLPGSARPTATAGLSACRSVTGNLACQNPSSRSSHCHADRQPVGHVTLACRQRRPMPGRGARPVGRRRSPSSLPTSVLRRRTRLGPLAAVSGREKAGHTAPRLYRTSNAPSNGDRSALACRENQKEIIRGSCDAAVPVHPRNLLSSITRKSAPVARFRLCRAP